MNAFRLSEKMQPKLENEIANWTFAQKQCLYYSSALIKYKWKWLNGERSAGILIWHCLSFENGDR